jgi:transcription elongation GreA/GreB family factor
MSRAFVKEPDGAEAVEDLADLPQSPHPNYVTRQGLAQLKERLKNAQARQRELLRTPDDPSTGPPLAQLAREMRYLESRIERAIPVDHTGQPADVVAFGAVVEVEAANGELKQFAIVGEDEAEAEHGKVSWVSPLARALTGAGIGDTVIWKRPAGDVELEIRAISYPG